MGILAGVLLRVRAFLFLGIGFLGLALLSIIWYAAVDLEQTWTLVCLRCRMGCVDRVGLGVAEKKRQQGRELSNA